LSSFTSVMGIQVAKQLRNLRVDECCATYHFQTRSQHQFNLLHLVLKDTGKLI
jgi:hypothetical protein